MQNLIKNNWDWDSAMFPLSVIGIYVLWGLVFKATLGSSCFYTFLVWKTKQQENWGKQFSLGHKDWWVQEQRFKSWQCVSR